MKNVTTNHLSKVKASERQRVILKFVPEQIIISIPKQYVIHSYLVDKTLH